MKKLILLILIFTIPLFFGCSIIPPIATGTQTFTYHVEEITSSEDDIGSQVVDLSDNEDYVEHRENIVSVDNISVTGTIWNHSEGAIAFETYADGDETSSYTTYYELTEYTHLVFRDVGLLPGGGSSHDIEWQEGDDWVLDPTYMAQLIIEDGVFKIYVATSEESYSVACDLTIVITVSVEL